MRASSAGWWLFSDATWVRTRNQKQFSREANGAKTNIYFLLVAYSSPWLVKGGYVPRLQWGFIRDLQKYKVLRGIDGWGGVSLAAADCVCISNFWGFTPDHSLGCTPENRRALPTPDSLCPPYLQTPPTLLFPVPVGGWVGLSTDRSGCRAAAV